MTRLPRDDYTFLREQGVTNRDIAARFGIQWDSLRRWGRRHDCWIPDPDERRAAEQLRQLRDSGAPFRSSTIQATNSLMVRGLVAAEIRAGRLRRVRPGGQELQGVVTA